MHPRIPGKHSPTSPVLLAHLNKEVDDKYFQSCCGYFISVTVKREKLQIKPQRRLVLHPEAISGHFSGHSIMSVHPKVGREGTGRVWREEKEWGKQCNSHFK